MDKVMMDGGYTAMDAYHIRYSDLELLKELGHGAFGTVFHGRLRKTQDVAIKTVRATKVTEATVQEFMRELQIMASSTTVCDAK